MGPKDLSTDALTFTEKQFSTSSSIYYPRKVITPVSFSSLPETLARQSSRGPDLLCSQRWQVCSRHKGNAKHFSWLLNICPFTGWTIHSYKTDACLTCFKILHLPSLRGKLSFHKTRRNKQMLIIVSKTCFLNSLPTLYIIS